MAATYPCQIIFIIEWLGRFSNIQLQMLGAVNRKMRRRLDSKRGGKKPKLAVQATGEVLRFATFKQRLECLLAAHVGMAIDDPLPLKARLVLCERYATLGLHLFLDL